MRPGRLDRILYVGPPDLLSRKEILNINFSKMSVANGVDVDRLAEMVRHLFPESFMSWFH